MNYPFNKPSILNMHRVLSLTLVGAMTCAALTGCFSFKKDTDTTEDTGSNMPNLVESADTEPETTEAPTEAPTEPEKDNLAIVKEQLSVRSSPSTGSPVNAVLDAGEKVEVIRADGVNGVQWAYIIASSTGTKGWVNTESLDMSNVESIMSPTSTPGAVENNNNTTGTDTNTTTNSNTSTNNSTTSTTGTSYGTVTATELRVRADASTDSAIVGSYKNGNRVTILETKNGWGRVKEGWISLQYVRMDGTAGQNACTGTITATELIVRNGPGKSFNKVSSVTKGQTVEILDQVSAEGAVWGNIKGGWICMDYVNVNGSVGGTISGSTSTGTTSGNGIGTATVTGNGLNIREGAGLSYKTVGGMAYGESAVVYERQQADGYTWGRTDKGWICLDYTNFR